MDSIALTISSSRLDSNRAESIYPLGSILCFEIVRGLGLQLDF